jgi:hypothetical protein
VLPGAERVLSAQRTSTPPWTPTLSAIRKQFNLTGCRHLVPSAHAKAAFKEVRGISKSRDGPNHLRLSSNHFRQPRRASAARPCYPGSEATKMSTPAFTPIDRSAINRANSQHSTGPRTAAGKQRSSLNALRHGLTAATPVLPTEDPAAYEAHRRAFLDEYQPATPTETQLVHELADTSWRLNRIPLLEADLLARAANPPFR